MSKLTDAEKLVRLRKGVKQKVDALIQTFVGTNYEWGEIKRDVEHGVREILVAERCEGMMVKDAETMPIVAWVEDGKLNVRVGRYIKN